MMKIVFFVIMLLPQVSIADNYVFFGKYLRSSLAAYPGATIETAQYRAGIHVEEAFIDDFMVGFAENETLIDSFFGGFTPASTNFKLGLWFDFGWSRIIVMHECRHPHEGRSDGRPEQYDLIEARYYLR